ncbi:hypothetical protein BJF95_00780 [Rhizobium oryziradicis]|uniref:Uncharacterized protein n=1 Tax=Rhizobium oryziradicis TaxID=1867956 RepID=A0A1Q8ZLN6_9HYPH|nr:hypothetical protein BJF95_00780 [Rhizobium oryziradicis]
MISSAHSPTFFNQPHSMPPAEKPYGKNMEKQRPATFDCLEKIRHAITVLDVRTVNHKTERVDNDVAVLDLLTHDIAATLSTFNGFNALLSITHRW